MKKRILLVIVILVLCLVTQIAKADNSTRIKELQKEGEGVIKQYEQAVAFQKQCESRIAEIRGAIAELQNQDKPKGDINGKTADKK